jgi:DNA-binding HxlR family transcriptional regulator/catechol 2,3-dioxygenase-like lactoylglutathione lyase family enzyme
MALPPPEPSLPGFQAAYPIMAALDLLGRRWILRILWELRDGARGFRALQGFCDDMSPSMLSQRLTLLQTTKLIRHTAEGAYGLTATGQELLRALAPVRDWADQWAAEVRAQGPQDQQDQHAQPAREVDAPARADGSSAMPLPTPPPSGSAKLTRVMPRLAVNDIHEALAFYEQLGFHATFSSHEFAIVKRGAVELQLSCTLVDPLANQSACWIGVTDIAALYQQVQATNPRAIPPRAHLASKPWGFKEFAVVDPSGVLITFGEPLAAPDSPQ